MSGAQSASIYKIEALLVAMENERLVLVLYHSSLHLLCSPPRLLSLSHELLFADWNDGQISRLCRIIIAIKTT